MKVRPFSAADLLRQNSPRKFATNSSRFALLRDQSPAPGSDEGRRFRSPSVKRKTAENVSYSEVTARNVPQVQVVDDGAQLLEKVGVSTAKVNSLCEKVKGELATLGAEPEICTIFSDLCDAIKCINETQTLLAEIKSGEDKSYSSVVQAPPKRSKQVPATGKIAPTMVDISTAHQVVNETKDEADLRRFKEAVKDAEKSILIFNLNMGSVPIMNQETTSKKATLALTTMAAKTEGKFSSTPSQDAVTAIDDILSVTTGMSFFGNSTKTYKNPKDTESGSYCTLPVKYEFSDKDTRIKAETTLRSLCKVSCTTPYPMILKECIKKVIDHVKTDFPGEYVRVNVNADKLSLSVARRANKESEWTYAKEDVQLPKEVLNVSTRTVPKDLLISNLPGNSSRYTPSKPDRSRISRKPSAMDGMDTNG